LHRLTCSWVYIDRVCQCIQYAPQ